MVAFNLAQLELSPHLSLPNIAKLGPQTFQLGVQAVRSSASVRSAFFALFPSGTDAALGNRCVALALPPTPHPNL